MPENKHSEVNEKDEKEVVVCRCEEVTEKEIRDAIRTFGVRSVNGVKRITRAGMGLCQGRSCEDIVKNIIAEETGQKLEDISSSSKRPPVIPVIVDLIAKSETRHD